MPKSPPNPPPAPTTSPSTTSSAPWRTPIAPTLTTCTWQSHLAHQTSCISQQNTPSMPPPRSQSGSSGRVSRSRLGKLKIRLMRRCRRAPWLIIPDSIRFTCRGSPWASTHGNFPRKSKFTTLRTRSFEIKAMLGRIELKITNWIRYFVD